MAEKKEEEKGMVASIVEVFKDQMKELEPKEATLAFVVLSIIGTFGLIGFTSAIASGLVKLVQVIGTVASSM